MKLLSDQSLSIILSITGFFVFACGDSFKKWLLLSYTIPETFVLTLSSGLIWAFAFSFKLGGIKSVMTINRPKLHILKAFVLVANMYCAIQGVKNLPLDTFYVIIFTAPLITTLLASLIYKETLSRMKLALILTGFSGVVLIANPFNGLDINYTGVIYTLLLAIFFSLNSIINKAFSRHDPQFPFILLPFMLALCLFTTLNNFAIPSVTLQTGLVAFVCGFTSVFGTLCLLKAFQIGNAASVANYHYTQLIWGIVLGYLLFSNEPTWMVIGGGGVIISSGLALYFYDRREARKCAKIML